MNLREILKQTRAGWMNAFRANDVPTMRRLDRRIHRLNRIIRAGVKASFDN